MPKFSRGSKHNRIEENEVDSAAGLPASCARKGMLERPKMTHLARLFSAPRAARMFVAVLFATCVFVVTSVALADKHRAVLYTEGGRGTEVASLVRGALPADTEIIQGEDFRKALLKQGQKQPLGLTVTLGSKRQAMLGRIGKAASELGAEVVIIGYVQRGRSGFELILLAVPAGSDNPSVDQTVPLDKPTTKDGVAAALKPIADAWKPTDSGTPTVTGPTGPTDNGEKPKVEPKRNDDDGKGWVRPKNVYGHEIFSINASFDVAFRMFGYNDGVTTNLRDYHVYGQPGVSARLEVFPLAPLGIVFLKDLGLTGEFRISPGISSATSDGTEYGTQWMRFGGGLRYRLPLGPKEKPFVLGLRGSFIRDGFVIDAEGDVADEAPSVQYSFMRVGLDGRFPIGPIAITAFGGYLGAIDSGAVHDRFTDPSIGGIDVGGGLTVPIALGFEARLQAEYVRWFYAFAPVIGDTFVAGGALDEYVHIEVGPQYLF